MHAVPSVFGVYTHAPFASQVPVPWVHSPPGVVVQSTHAWPPMPQVASADAMHSPAAQQPLGHVAGPHAGFTHTPSLQISPSAHASPTPHEHTPSGEQLSARSEGQATQALPFAPHAVSERALQVFPLQHPSVHCVAHQLHMPSAQLEPEGQVSHDNPPVPHASTCVPGLHTLS